MMSINILTIIVLGVTLAVVYYKNDKASPLAAFCAIWIVVIALYSLRLYEIDPISNNTMWILFCGISSFCIGYSAMNKVKLRVKRSKYSFDWRLIRLICAVIILVSLPYYVNSLITMVQGGITSAVYKIMLAKGEADTGGFLMQYIVKPLEFILIGFSGYVFTNKIKERFVFASGVYLCIIKFICTGSKSAIVFYGLIFVFSGIYQLERKNRELSNNEKKQRHLPFKWKITFLGIVAAFLATMNASVNIFKSLYFYLCGCVPMLDKVVNTSFYFDGVHTHGWLSFNGMFRAIISLLEQIGINLNTYEFDRAYDIIVRFEYTTSVAPGVNYNAFTTYLSAFYIDFGMIGVVLMSLLFGMGACYIYRRFKIEKSPARFAQLTIMYYIVVFSIVRFQFSHLIFAMAFIYATVICAVGNSKYKIVFNQR